LSPETLESRLRALKARIIA